MWSLFHLLISVTILLTTSSLSECIRIRRSGIAGYDDPYGLTNAFSGMDRPRRQDYRTLLRKRMFEDDDSYFNPNAGSSLDIDPLDFSRSSRYNDDIQGYLSDYAYQPVETSFDVLERYPLPLPYEGLTDRGYGPQKRTAYKPHRVVPSLDELKSIFGEADVPMKRLAVKRQEPASGSINANEAVGENTESEKNKEDLVKEWGKLINAAEQLTKTNVKTETVDETTEQESDTEDIDKDLEDALSDSKEDDFVNDELEDLQNNESKEESESPKQTPLEERLPQSKSKRASSEGDSSDYILSLLKEISNLKRRLYAEELLKDLQSRENDYLANALKFATMDQLQEGDQFVMNEYNDIAKATETEELIQQIADGLEEEEEEEDEEDNENTGFDKFIEPEVKRSEGETINSDQWFETPVDENVGIGALLEGYDNNEDGEEEELNDDEFGGSERPIDIPYLDDELENSDEEPEMETAVAEIEEDSNENTKGQEYLLAKLISNLSPGTLERVISDLEEQEIAEETGVCAPVLELSQNCAFADAKGIPIDAEARNLCVRHQLCYTCGSALGISPDRCDNGYKGTVISECENDVKCVRAAAFFLHLMTSRYHTYEEYSPQQCKNQCVADFIYGV